jgi:hypothetical protein
MTEYYIELQDAQGTCFCSTDIRDDVIYYDDLDDARMDAKNSLSDFFVVSRIIDTQTKRVVDFFGV